MTRSPPLKIVAALGAGLLVPGCETASDLADAALASCSAPVAYLSGWGASLPTAPDYDPFGGYVFAYWIDDQGNACSGDPGRNGQVGPAVIRAMTPGADAAVATNGPISSTQLSAYQQIPFSYANYGAGGLHFVQFYATAFRARADGAIWTTKSDGVFGRTVVVDMAAPGCLSPTAFKVNALVFPPGGPPSAGQDPQRCRVKASPAGPMDRQALDGVHVTDLPHGGEVREIP